MKEKFPIALVGEKVDLTYPYEHLGTGPDDLKKLASGDHPFMALLRESQHPLILVGQGALDRPDGEAIQSLCAKIAVEAGAVGTGDSHLEAENRLVGFGALDKDWNGYCVLHDAAARVGGLDIGFVPGKKGLATERIMSDSEVLLLLGADELDMERINGFVIYVGSHGDAGAHRADLILPSCAWPEKSAIYVNTEGRPQMSNRAYFPPGEAKEDWAIFRALTGVGGKRAGVLSKPLPFDSLAELREDLFPEFPHLMRLGEIESANPSKLKALAKGSATLTDKPFESPVRDFYLTNPAARASRIMAECSRVFSTGRGAGKRSAPARAKASKANGRRKPETNA